MTFSFRSLLVALVIAGPAVVPANAVAEDPLSLSVSSTLGRVPAATVAATEAETAPAAVTSGVSPTEALPAGHAAAPADEALPATEIAAHPTPPGAIDLTESPDGYRLTAYDPEFEKQMEIARDVMKRRRNVLRELAK